MVMDMRLQQKQAMFTSNLIYFLFSCIVIIQNIYYQFTSKEFPLSVEDNYKRYLIIWFIMYVVAFGIILILSKNKGGILFAPYTLATATSMPIFIRSYGTYAVIGYLVITLICLLIDRAYIRRKYNKSLMN